MRDIILIIMVAALAGCSKPPKQVNSSAAVGEITAPGHWHETTILNDEANIQVCNERKEQYLIVLTEPKTDFQLSMSLEEFSNLTRQGLVDAYRGKATHPQQIKINGRNAIQSEIRGTVDGVGVFYLHVCIEGKKHFHQILAWTTSALENKNRSVLESAIKTFKE